MVRKVFSIIFLVFAGLNMTGVMTVGFIHWPPGISVRLVYTLVLILAGLPLAVGVLLAHRGRRKHYAGVTLLSVAAFSVLQVITMLVMVNADVFMKARTNSFTFNTSPSAVSIVFVLAIAALGWWQIKTAKADKLRDASEREALERPVEFWRDEAAGV
jgi:hypothetical protein